MNTLAEELQTQLSYSQARRERDYDAHRQAQLASRTQGGSKKTGQPGTHSSGQGSVQVLHSGSSHGTGMHQSAPQYGDTHAGSPIPYPTFTHLAPPQNTSQTNPLNLTRIQNPSHEYRPNIHGQHAPPLLHNHEAGGHRNRGRSSSSQGQHGQQPSTSRPSGNAAMSGQYSTGVQVPGRGKAPYMPSRGQMSKGGPSKKTDYDSDSDDFESNEKKYNARRKYRD